MTVAPSPHCIRQRRRPDRIFVWCTCGWRRKVYDLSRTVRLGKVRVAAFYHLHPELGEPSGRKTHIG